jgi:ornithine decarboxylase
LPVDSDLESVLSSSPSSSDGNLSFDSELSFFQDTSVSHESVLKAQVLETLRSSTQISIVPSCISNQELVQRWTSKILDDDAFYLVDLNSVFQKLFQWKSLLPRVEPFFAIKCNPDPVIIRTLHELGAGFDCASKQEIATVQAVGAENQNIIFANPCKAQAQLEYAETHGVRMMTFDNAAELLKIKKYCPSAQVVLRIITDDSKSVCRFGTKFGASFVDAVKLISLCKDLGLDLIGVSFHVGSGCYSVDSFVNALDRARKVFDAAEKFGFFLQLLDIGGGWPGDDSLTPNFSCIANAIRDHIDDLFPPQVRVISEPGRYFTSESHVLAVNIHSRRDIHRNLTDKSGFEDLSRPIDEAVEAELERASHAAIAAQKHSENLEFKYYVNDGVYASFNCILFDHAHVTPIPLRTTSPDESRHLCEIFGPTCDSMDLISKRISLPKMEVGEWLYFEQMGAYTRAASTEFNGFSLPNVHYICRA